MFNQLEGVNEFCTGNVKYASGVSNLEVDKKQHFFLQIPSFDHFKT